MGGGERRVSLVATSYRSLKNVGERALKGKKCKT